MIRARAAWARFGVPLLAAALGILYFIACEGAAKIRPTQVGWVMQGDWATHYLGWLMWRNAPWSLPLGKLPNLLAPIGTTLGYTDSNPWVSTLAKPFSGWMPEQFQLMGPFMALSFALQGLFGALIVRQLSPRWADQLLGGALFVLAPILLWREAHDSLTAHWLLLGVFWLHLRPTAEWRRLLGWMFGFNMIAAGIHPYLAAMVLALSCALLVKLALVDRVLTRWVAIAATVGVAVSVLGVFTLFGYFSAHDRGGGGFEVFGSDLLGFVNPFGRSRFIPELAHTRQEGEGFAYLGLGVLLLLAVAVGLLVWSLRKKRPLGLPSLRALGITALLLAIFAWSESVKVLGQQVLDLSKLYAPFMGVVAPFRSCGRFIWSLHYFLLLAAIAIVLRAFAERARVGTAVLGLALLVQAVDLKVAWNPGNAQGAEYAFLHSPHWAAAKGHYEHLALYPPVVIMGNGDGCEGGFPSWLYIPFGIEAYRQGLSSNSAYVARADDDRVHAMCHELDRALQAGEIDPKTIYVIHPSKFPGLSAALPKLACGQLDGTLACVRAQNQDPFRAGLSGVRLHGG